MGLSNGIITAPVGVDDVRRALGIGGTDVGVICSSDKINKWARYKPVVLPNVLGRLTKAQLSSVMYGLTPTVNSLLKTKSDANGTSEVASIDELNSIIAANAQWTYTKPQGTLSSPLRLTDFYAPSDNDRAFGYDHNTTEPVGNVQSWGVGLSWIQHTANSSSMAMGNNGDYSSNWILSTDKTTEGGTSPLFSFLSLRYGEETQNNINNAGTHVIPLTELLDNTGTAATNKHWRLALAVQVPKSTTELTYMRLFTSRASIWRCMSDGSLNTNQQTLVQHILPSMGTNQYLCKLISEHAARLYAMTSGTDVLGNKKLTVENPSFELPALLCVVSDSYMNIIDGSPSLTNVKMTSASNIYSAPSAITRTSIVVTDDVHFTESQIRAYTYISISTVGTGQTTGNSSTPSSQRLQINAIQLTQIKEITNSMTLEISYYVEYNYVSGWNGTTPIISTGSISGSVTLSAGVDVSKQLYAAPGLSVTSKTLSVI